MPPRTLFRILASPGTGKFQWEIYEGVQSTLYFLERIQPGISSFQSNDMLLINHMDLTCMHALEHFKLVIRV